MGRKPDTGRYDSREELCDEVWAFYLGTTCSMARIALVCRTSPAVVARIVNTAERIPSEQERDRLNGLRVGRTGRYE